ncbi:MAG TPA: flagellar hook-length control protein FliK [Candidatus Coprocola pullicola]|nr:flagellar hook-length control protein FliK [Candidatus Coprocola pullicola]
MDTSVKVSDFVAMQGQMMSQKLTGANYKNDAFYRFMKQTADTQKTSDSSSSKRDTSTKETSKNDTLDKTEDSTKSDTEKPEDVTKDVQDTKDNMLQQMDLALLAATVSANMVTTQQTQKGKAVVKEPAVQSEILTQIDANMAQQTKQTAQPNQSIPQNLGEKAVQVTTEQPQTMTQETVSKQEVPKEVVNTTNTEQNQKQSETVKTDAKVITTDQTTQKSVTVAKETTQQNDAQANTSPDTEATKQASEVPVKKTFSEDVITVKVGENAQINDPEMTQKLADKMLTKFSQNQNEFEIQLTPKELGKITIKLMMENGQAHISMFAENAKTMSLLAEKAKELGAIIQQHTGNQTNVEVVDQKTMENQNQNKEQKGDGFARQQQEQQRQHQERLRQEQSRDFVQQMRLGLWNLIE